MYMEEKDTIAAIATGMGNSGIGIIRISGTDAIGVADRVFRGKKKASAMETYTAAFGHVVDENENVIQQVVNDEISFGFVVGKPNNSNLVTRLVKSIDLVAYVYNGHRLFDEKQVEISDLKTEKIISMNEKYHVYHDVINACHLNSFNPNIVARVGEGESIYRLVENRVGIGISPKFFSDNEDIKAVEIKDAYSWDVYGVYRVDSADRDLAKRFLEAMNESKS